jgi:hypothetical protein
MNTKAIPFQFQFQRIYTGKLPTRPRVASSLARPGGYAPRTPRRPPGNILLGERTEQVRVPATPLSHITWGPSIDPWLGLTCHMALKQLRPSDGGDRNAKVPPPPALYGRPVPGQKKNCRTGAVVGPRRRTVRNHGPSLPDSVPVPFASVIERSWWPSCGVMVAGLVGPPVLGFPAGTPHRHLEAACSFCSFLCFFSSFLCLTKNVMPLMIREQSSSRYVASYIMYTGTRSGF